jgi:quercetin dioxygenase-like cupin family protein
MRRFWIVSWSGLAAGLLAAQSLSQAPGPQPQAIPLECAQVDCRLLAGPPDSAGMHGGFVRLKPGQTVGWHTTGQNEEALVVLRGKGTALIEGKPGIPFVAPALVYIPPGTRHNVENTGSDPVEYGYVVAPAKTP